jgi:hypothetical protein
LICTDLVQQTSTTTIHLTTVATQDKAWSYTWQTSRDDFHSPCHGDL